jgi:TolB protein
MDASGGNVTQLTANPRGDWQPAWSPDGRKIAYARVTYYTTDIYIRDVDGTGNTPLTQNFDYASNPSWSPDGLNLVFSSVVGDASGNDSEIIMVGYDGSRPASFIPPKPAFNAAWR